MGSLWDLNNEDRKKFDEIVAVIVSRKSCCSEFEKSKLVDLYKTHGAVKLLFVIDKCMSNDWLKPDRWESLMEIVERYGIDKTLEAIKAMNRLENHSIATVEGIANGTIPTRRVRTQDSRPEPRQGTTDGLTAMANLLQKYPTPDFYYDARSAQTWLNAKNLGFELWPEYFDRAGRDEHGRDLVQLKAEYR